VLDDLGEMRVFRFSITSAPRQFGEAKQLSHGPRVGRDFWFRNRGFRSGDR
jgi:hypothetical protein